MRNSLTLTLFLFAGVSLFSAEARPVPKTGGVCFRFDDNKPPEQWRMMGELFERYGYRMSLALVSQELNENQARVLRELAGKGHSLMDHLPNHAVYRIRARTPRETPTITLTSAPATLGARICSRRRSEPRVPGKSWRRGACGLPCVLHAARRARRRHSIGSKVDINNPLWTKTAAR